MLPRKGVAVYKGTAFTVENSSRITIKGYDISGFYYALEAYNFNGLTIKRLRSLGFQRALEIDLSEAKLGAAEGVHIANCGGIWRAVILECAGMK